VDIHLVHALILTQFEAELVGALDWNSVIAQDFTVHALYCQETQQLLFHSDNLKSDPLDKIAEIKDIILKIGNAIEDCNTILVVPPTINEYDSEAIKTLLLGL
jgi:hypothetical protein